MILDWKRARQFDCEGGKNWLVREPRRKKAAELGTETLTELPILFLVFNRPDTTTRVMEAIRAARPPRLYVAADAPRDRPGEAEKSEEARRIATAVDWPCEVNTLFRGSNLGCRRAVSEGVTWFFENEPEGIVLEDDCVPSASFFAFCAELLHRFRDDEQIMCITGDNFQDDMGDYPSSYYFSKYNHVWGWASWRRAWERYDVGMKLFPAFVDAGGLDAMSRTPGFAKSWEKTLRSVYEGKVDTWDAQWLFACWINNGLTCTPRVNLVSNIGFRSDATHTKDPASSSANLPAGDLVFPLVHPERVAVDEDLDAHVDVAHFGIKPDKVRWRRRLENSVKEALWSAGRRSR